MPPTGPRRGPAERPSGRRPGAPRPPGTRSTSRSTLGRAGAVPELAQRRTANRARRGIAGAVAFVLLVLLLGPTLTTYLEQRREISTLQERVAAQQADVAAKEREKHLWNDPAYVEQQARERLKFVKVGERAYSIIDLDKTLPAQDEASRESASAHPWYGHLWESVKVADNPQRGLR